MGLFRIPPCQPGQPPPGHPDTRPEAGALVRLDALPGDPGSRLPPGDCNRQHERRRYAASPAGNQEVCGRRCCQCPCCCRSSSSSGGRRTAADYEDGRAHLPGMLSSPDHKILHVHCILSLILPCYVQVLTHFHLTCSLCPPVLPFLPPLFSLPTITQVEFVREIHRLVKHLRHRLENPREPTDIFGYDAPKPDELAK